MKKFPILGEMDSCFKSHATTRNRHACSLSLSLAVKMVNHYIRKRADLRMAYDRAYAPPVVDELPDSPSAAQKKKYNEQIGALAFYESRKAEDVLCQFVNGLKKDLRELLIRQDDLLKTPVEIVVKRIATLEEESGGVLQVASVSEPSGKVNPTGADKHFSEIEEMVNKTVELKLEEFRSSQSPLSAAVRRGGKQTGRQRPGAKPTDVCRQSLQWSWPLGSQLPDFKRERGWPRTPTPALNSCKGVNYPYLPQKEPVINTVQGGKAVSRKSYHVEGAVNKEKEIFLVDTSRGEPDIFKYSWFGDQRFSSLPCFNNSPAHYCSLRSGSKIEAGWCSNKMEFLRGR